MRLRILSMKYLILYITVFCFVKANAQVEKHYLRQGNKDYKDKNYEEAQINYRKALNENGNSYESNFNLGDALYQQNDYNGAAQKFEVAASAARNKTEKAKALHNMGNAFLKAGRLTQAINAYKQALRNNPDDKETKYNLSYALKKQKQQEEQQKQQQQKDKQDKQDNQDKKDKKDEKDKGKQNQKNQSQEDKEKGQDKPDKEKEKQDKQQKEVEDEKPEEDKKGQQNQQQPQEGKMSDAEAERILDAIKSEEQKVQQRIFQRNKDQQKKNNAKGKQW
jgi:Ca-activated chloride channel homolog